MHYLRKFIIFFIILLFIEFSWGGKRDTLSTGQTLKDKDADFLISAKNTFTLRFFTIGMSVNRYLGIYYSNDPENRVVWVANRDNPLSGRSGVLAFHTPNDLVIHGSDLKVPIWSTRFLGSGKNYTAQLLDTGNLIVFEEDKKKVIAWQSFDHPTDTWLPEMKLGVNRKTGLNWSLTAWKSDADPGIAEYSLRMDVIREFSELSLYRGSSRRWRTGPLNGVRLGEISPTYIFNVTYVDNEDEVYMTYSMREPSTFSVIAVIPNGGFMTMSEWKPNMLNWTAVSFFPKGLCDSYNHCGPNRYCHSPSRAVRYECSCFPGFERNKSEKLEGGCARKRDRNVCRNGEGFVKLSSMKMPDSTTARMDMKRGSKECEKECLRDCNCTAYTYATEKDIVCVMWYGNLLDTRKYETGGQDLFIRVDAIELGELARNWTQQQHYSSSNKKFNIFAVVTCIGVVTALIAVFILCWHIHKRKRGLRPRAEQGPANNLLNEVFDARETNGNFHFIDLISLVEATNNFSDENKLGQGGFGSVYKGTLKDGQVIAVKRLSETSGQGVVEFKNEATLIARLQHINLVRLLGCCAEQDERVLIYEYMPNKSLNSMIFDQEKGACLDWAQRFSIIMGITGGLIYLHHGSSLKIIHRDLKASNILLDAQMIPKISDFGMARFFANDEVEAITKRIVGTCGYMSPEYAMEGICSIKSDVYSFGILLLEIVSGRKNNSFYNEESLNLVGHAWKLWCEERALELVDPLLGDYSTKIVLRCMHVGLLSVQLRADDRPNMSEINDMLLSDTNLPPPRQPAFINIKFGNEYAASSSNQSTSSSQYMSSSTAGAHSVNDLTVSVIVPR